MSATQTGEEKTESRSPFQGKDDISRYEISEKLMHWAQEKVCEWRKGRRKQKKDEMG